MTERLSKEQPKQMVIDKKAPKLSKGENNDKERSDMAR